MVAFTGGFFGKKELIVAKKEHLVIINRGVKEFNAWRRLYPQIEVDLNEADLSYLDLAGINLSGAKMYKAELRGTKLNNATLAKAYLRKANFKDTHANSADFSGAVLDWIYFDCTEMEGVKMDENTSLLGTNFHGARGLPREIQKRVLEELKNSWGSEQRSAKWGVSL